MPNRIKAVLFDMDGVLVDVSGSYRRAIQETARHFTGRDVSAGAIQRYKNRGGFNDDWKLTHALVVDASMDVPFNRVVEEFQRRYRGENWDGFIVGEPPLVSTALLEELSQKGIVLGIVTGRPDAEARWTVDRLGWHDFFPLIVAMEKQAGRGKPDPYPLQHALGACAAAGSVVNPDEAVYVGDTVDDMVAARAAGLWAVGVVPPYLSREEHATVLSESGAHVVLETIDDLPAIVESIPHGFSSSTTPNAGNENL